MKPAATVRRCPRCSAPMVCPRCNGAKGGKVVTPAKLAALAAARRARLRWTVGERVTAHLRAKRTWEGEVLRVGGGRPGRRRLTVLVTRSIGKFSGVLGLAAPYEATIHEHQVARVRA